MTKDKNIPPEEEIENLEIDDASEEVVSAAPITKKYDEQMRMLVTQKLDIPLRSLIPMLNEKQLNLRPDFQRRDRWDELKQSRFVESVIMNVPIPPVFLGEDEYGTYVVLDGRQRLTAISSYMQNKFALSGLAVWPEINGKRFHEIGEVQNYILRRFIPAVVILKESSKEIKYDVFDRLNTGGVVAVPMEIRNAVFRGDFNKHLKYLSENQLFRELWGIPTDASLLENNNLYETMADVELVLRFFVIQNYTSISGPLKDHLGNFMKIRNVEYGKNPMLKDQDENIFKKALVAAKKIFGTEAFRKPIDGKTSKRSAPLADAILYGCSKIEVSKFDSTKIDKARKGLENLFKQNTDFLSAVSKGTNGKGAIATRVEAVERMLIAIQNS